MTSNSGKRREIWTLRWCPRDENLNDCLLGKGWGMRVRDNGLVHHCMLLTLAKPVPLSCIFSFSSPFDPHPVTIQGRKRTGHAFIDVEFI